MVPPRVSRSRFPSLSGGTRHIHSSMHRYRVHNEPMGCADIDGPGCFDGCYRNTQEIMEESDCVNRYVVTSLALIHHHHAVFLKKGYYLFNTQMLVIIALYYMPSDCRGRLAEGKTRWVVELLAYMETMMDMERTADVVTTSSSSALAMRDTIWRCGVPSHCPTLRWITAVTIDYCSMSSPSPPH